MNRPPGTRVGSYEILGPLGAGGMGDVYRARDTKLNRDVAIKFLPELFAADPERIVRFEREAQALAALNHTNIAQVFGVLESPAALVMELVEGEDLSQRIARGPIALDETVAVATQIAEALQAAHDAGIIHRDLKPANIRVRPDGVVKVLDFGLAKALDIATPYAPAGAVNSPTFTTPAMTQAGIILGTAAYMAPEQAKGATVDRRADVWAFGAVLYEMLTGRSCFAGDSVGEVIAAVIKDSPDFSALPANVPAPLHRLLVRCLDKNPKRRLSAIGDVRWDLEESLHPGTAAGTPATRTRRAWLPWIAAATAVAVAVWALANRRDGDGPDVEGHFTMELPQEAPLVVDDQPRRSEGPLVLSPDGRHLVYVAPYGGGTRLFVRALADLTPREVAGTDGAVHPFVSPDGSSVGFFAGGKLRKTSLAGGTATTLADAPDGRGASWGRDGEIVFAPTGSSGLFLVSDAGGTPRRLTTLDAAAGEDEHGWPQVLPGHDAILFTVIAWSRETSEIFIVNRKTGERRLVQDNASFARYVPAAEGAGGHLVFVRDGALLAARFDPGRPERAGSPVAVLDAVRTGQFDISGTGVLVYAPGGRHADTFSLVWVDRKGVATPVNELTRGYEDLHLSPDGRRVVATVEEPGADYPAHVWLADAERRTITRVTFDGFSRDPVWAPDGRSIVFGSKRGKDTFGLFVQRLDGRSAAELAWASPIPIWPDPQSWTPDGRTVVFATKGKDTGNDIWTLSLDGGTARPWLATPAAESAGRLSPDGRWMAYCSNASGREEVYVQPYPGPGAQHLVSEGGGTNPIWSRDGREIFYRRDNELVAVTVDADPVLTTGSPVVLFSGRYRLSGRDFDVSPDGTRFVMMRPDGARTASTIRLLLNWRRILDARLKGRGD